MKRVDWVLVWIVLVPVMLGVVGLLTLLARGVSYGVRPAEMLARMSRLTPSVLMLPAALLAAFLAMLLLWRLQARGVKPLPTVALTIVAWCVLTVAMLLATAGFLALAVAFLSA
jgi:hypothetical protein